MGKIIKDGFAFLEYANAGLIRKIEDVQELKTELIACSETKTHIEMSQYALLLAEHIVSVGGLERSEDIEACFAVNRRWQNREIKFQEALLVAGRLQDSARTERNQLRAKALRAMGQVAATPHVRWHPLVASEYAVVMINLLHPHDLKPVREERELQIAWMKSV